MVFQSGRFPTVSSGLNGLPLRSYSDRKPRTQWSSTQVDEHVNAELSPSYSSNAISGTTMAILKDSKSY